jgi:hypothetical protein
LTKKWYIGLVKDKFEAFYLYNAITRAEKPFFYPYKNIIGPFKTKRAALWAEKYGLKNPRFQQVDDAERLAKEENTIAREFKLIEQY